MLDSTTVRVGFHAGKSPYCRPHGGHELPFQGGHRSARRLHRSMTGYAPTPLVELSGLAKRGGVRSVLVKDESPRFGLNAFKALGGLYALFRVVCRELGLDYRTATMDTLKSPEYRDRVSLHGVHHHHGRKPRCGVSHGLRECWAAAPMCSCREAL